MITYTSLNTKREGTMKLISKLLLSIFMIFGLVACGESCEHENTVTVYTEGKWLDLNKVVSCEDCDEEIEETDLKAIEYIFNKELINEKGIKVTIDKLVIDGWKIIELMMVVEGTSDSKRTFKTTSAFINDSDSGAFIYADGLSNNRKSNESHHIYDEIEVNDFFKSQDYLIEIDYSIINTDTYDVLKEGSISFNLNEYTSINEVIE